MRRSRRDEDYMTPRELVDQAFQNFSLSLIPTDDFMTASKRAATKIYEVLKENSKVPIVRMYGGTMGKHTAIMSRDLDFTVFIDDPEPSFFNVLNDFQTVVADGFGVDVKRTASAIQFIVPEHGIGGPDTAGFVINLIPAANLVPSNSPTKLGKSSAEIQLDRVVSRLQKEPEKLHFWKTALVECHLEFLKQQDSFTMDVIRLAKFWYKSVYTGELILNAKMLLELTAIAAARHCGSRREYSLHGALMIFLVYISRLDHLKIAFFFNQRWSCYHDSTGRAVPGDVQTILRRPDLSTLSSFVFEPANCRHNLLDDIPHFAMKKLVEFAKESMTRMQIPRVVAVERGTPYLNLLSYFRPQPHKLLHSFELGRPMHRGNGAVEYFCTGVSTVKALSPTMILRKDLNTIMNFNEKRPDQQTKFMKFLDAHLQFLAAVVDASVCSNKKQRLDEVVESVCNIVDEEIKGDSGRQWRVDADKRHDGYDVTFTAPILVEDGLGGVVLSIKFNPKGGLGGCYNNLIRY